MNATLKKLVLVLVMLVVSVAARAADFIVGGIAYEVRSDEDLTCAVVSHPDQYSGDVDSRFGHLQRPNLRGSGDSR